MNLNEYLIDILVDAILSDLHTGTSEWDDPTGDKAVQIEELQEKHTL